MMLKVKAPNILVQCLADNILELIKDNVSKRNRIIDTLRGTYLKSGIATQVQLQRKLWSLKLIDLQNLPPSLDSLFSPDLQDTQYEELLALA